MQLAFLDNVEYKDDIDDQIWVVETFCPKNSDIVWERVLPEINGGSGFGAINTTEWITVVSFICSIIGWVYRLVKNVIEGNV